MTATNPNLIELQRKVKEATKNVTAAKKAVSVAKNAIGDYFKQRLSICEDKGILVDTVDGWESRNGGFYLRVNNNKVFVQHSGGYGYELDLIDDYMSELEFIIHNCKDLYEETGEKSYKDEMNKEKNKYEILESIVNILYN